MKIAILGDSHFGMRNDSQIFHDYYRKFYQEVFFPRIRAEGITTVIQTGDLFDRRKFINYNTLNLCKSYFFDEFTKGDLKLITYLGNHDLYFKNTLSVNSPELTLGEYIDAGYIQVIKEPTQISLGNTNIDIIPWICNENELAVKRFIQETKNQICFGHFEIAGFNMDKGVVCHDGMAREDLSKYEIVVSGHFHHRSSDGHIFYVGTPGEMTWSDWDDPRGFHILDTNTRQLEFIPNEDKLFHKVEYDDANETLQSIDEKDYSEYYNRYVKVIVTNKTNLVLFDRFISNFYNAQPADLGIVEDFSDYSTLDDLMAGGIDQADTTNVILDRYIESFSEQGLDKERLKTVMRNIYNQAQALENA